MSFEGRFDEESMTLEVSGSKMDLESLDRALDWMNEVRRHLAARKLADDGGLRWEFRRGEAPTAQFMRGKESWMRPFPLVTIKTRKARECSACQSAIEPGTSCWRQAPGDWSGHSYDRFCERCVERGAAPCPPTLRLIV